MNRFRQGFHYSFFFGEGEPEPIVGTKAEDGLPIPEGEVYGGQLPNVEVYGVNLPKITVEAKRKIKEREDFTKKEDAQKVVQLQKDLDAAYEGPFWSTAVDDSPDGSGVIGGDGTYNYEKINGGEDAENKSGGTLNYNIARLEEEKKQEGVVVVGNAKSHLNNLKQDNK